MPSDPTTTAADHEFFEPCPICGTPTIPVGERTGPKGMDFTPEIVHAAHVKADEWREAFGWRENP